MSDRAARGGLDAFVRIGEEVREVLERRRASMVAVRIVRPKFVARRRAEAGCTTPDGAGERASEDETPEESPVVIAELPELPILRGLAGPGMLADTIVHRWQDHLPLHRLSLIYARDGVVLARSTMCGWHEQLADLAEPLVEAMLRDAFTQPVLCVDATGVLVRAKEQCRRAHFWVLVAPGRHVLYRYSHKHDSEAVDHLLAGYKGYLVADAATVYDHLYSSGHVIEVGCMAHCRRYFCQLGPVVLGERDVPALVAEARAPRRPAPLILVSVDNGTREPLVDPHELARRLAGMVKVVWLSMVNASSRLKDELMTRGFSEKFGCFHGGVRILWPGIEKGDNPYDHLLLLPMRLETMPVRTRTEQVAGLFCEMIAEDEDLRAWLREVDAPARPEPLRRQAPEPPQSPTAVARTSGESS